MKISIISDEHFPYKGADTEVIVNTAAALGKAGADVTLVTPWLWHKQPEDGYLYDYYGVSTSFKHQAIFNPFPPERIIRSQQFLHALLCSMRSSFWQADIVHTRDHSPLALLHLLRRPWCYETYRRHAAEKPWLPRWTRTINFKRAVGAVTHSQQSCDDLIQLGFDPNAVVVARPGFNSTAFQSEVTQADARQKLSLDPHVKLVGYVGNIGAGKGVDLCVKAMEPIHNAHLLVVGGNEAEVHALNMSIPAEQRNRVHLKGHQASAKVPLFLSACDVVIIPPLERNSRGPLLDKILPRVLPGTPLKIYAYWAAKKPIVAAHQVHSMELLKHEDTALLYDAESMTAFTHGIQRALSETSIAHFIAQQGAKQVQTMTYAHRAQHMLQFYERRLMSMHPL